jgi:hypothetical protein
LNISLKVMDIPLAIAAASLTIDIAVVYRVVGGRLLIG